MSRKLIGPKSKILAKRRKLDLDLDSWRTSATSLGNLFKIMYRKKIATDMIIKTGHGSAACEIECHSIVLKGHSPVFEAMLSERWALNADQESCQRTITLTEDDPKHTRAFVRMLYSDWTEKDFTMHNIPKEVTPESAVGVLALAHKYMAHHIIRRMEHYIYSFMYKKSVEQIVELYMLLKNLLVCNKGQSGRRILRTVENCIIGNAKSVFSSDAVLQFQRLDLIKFLQYELWCPEDIIYYGCVKWAKDKCRKNNVLVIGNNMRTYLGDAVIQLIRFSLLEKAIITNEVVPSGILTPEECIQLLSYKLNRACTSLNNTFPAKERFTDDEIVLRRLDLDMISKNMVDFSSPHGFEMTVSQEIDISSMYFYTGDEKCKFKCEVEFDFNQEAKNVTTFREDAAPLIYRRCIGFRLVPMVRIPKDTSIFIKFTITGGKTYIADENVAEETKEIVIFNDNSISFTFKRSLMECGLKQIPVITFSTAALSSTNGDDDDDTAYLSSDSEASLATLHGRH